MIRRASVVTHAQMHVGHVFFEIRNFFVALTTQARMDRARHLSESQSARCAQNNNSHASFKDGACMVDGQTLESGLPSDKILR